VDGKPVLLVYKASDIPQIEKTFARWRAKALELGIGELLIWICRTTNTTAETLKITHLVDGEVEFPPHNMRYDFLRLREIDLDGQEAELYDYDKLSAFMTERLKREKGTEGPVPVYRTCMMGWDNAARRAEKWTTYCGFSLKGLYRWAAALVDDSREKFDKDDAFVFVNAWNEWCEGTYLEPDRKYGYAAINTLSKAICGLPLEDAGRGEREETAKETGCSP